MRENLFRYLALGLLIVLGMFMIISMVAAADTIIFGTENAAREQRVENGQFTVFAPLTETESKKITDKGVTLEEHFYLDYALDNDVVLRVFPSRQKIDLAQTDYGKMPEKEGEILLEKRYCDENNLSVGDEVKIGGHSFEICGIGTLYALGVKRTELLRHYLVLPVIVTLIAGIIGTIIGYSVFGVNSQMQDVYNYFSVPDLDILYEPYLLIYGIVMPPIAAIVTNYLVIRRKLQKPALVLIRNEQKNGKNQNQFGQRYEI